MSLAETAVATGMVGLMALGVASLSGNLSDAAERAEGLVQRTEFTASLNTYIASSLGCEDLKASTNGAPFTTTPQPIVFSRWNFMGMGKIQGGFDGSKRKLTNFKYMTLEEFDGFIKAEANPQQIVSKTALGEEILNKATLTLRVSLLVAGREYKHLYNVPVLLKTNGELMFCSDERNIAESCSAIKGAYNAVTKKCDLNSGCLIRGSYSVLECNPAGNCNQRFGSAAVNQFTGAQSCPPGSVAEQTHSSSWQTQASTCQKKQVCNIANTMRWFTCMACPP